MSKTRSIFEQVKNDGNQLPLPCANLRDCKTLGDVFFYVLENYEMDQPVSTAGTSLLGAYLKNAKKK